MYAYIRGGDNHLCFKWHKNRKEATEWVEFQKQWFDICYDDADYGVVTDKQFRAIFPDEKYRNVFQYRRIGDKLSQWIEERQEILKKQKEMKE